MADEQTRRRRSPLRALIKTVRPQQWVKNLFVAAPLVFARHLTDSAYLVRTAIAVIAFCLLSGAVYAFNDVRDVKGDREHPTKRYRPIAARELSERAALIAAAVLAVGSLAAMFALSPLAGVYATAYLVQNVAYSIKLKQIAFVDVGLIASGFLLRVLGGAAAIDVPPSEWLLLCTALLATFLGLGKRAHELAWASRAGTVATTRAALAGYKIEVVRIAMFVLGAATVAAYAMYTVDSHTKSFFGNKELVYSTPFVALGIVRFLFLALWYPKDESPTEAMLRDPYFLAILAAATATVLYIIYG